MNINTMWVLIANSCYGKIFEVQGHGSHIKEIYHFDNPEGRKKSGEILNERPGRAFDKVGGGRHALGKEGAEHVHELKVFASKLAGHLHRGALERSFQELALIAPPQFLGELHAAIDEQTKKLLVKSVGKDLPVNIHDQDRIEHICEYLDLWNHHK